MSEENIKPMFQLNVCMRMEWKKVERKILFKKRVLSSPFFFVDNEEDPPTREELIWNVYGGLTEKQIEQFLIVAR